ncbi:hypothetical protein CYMTET_55874 [Cymbomonas tetramitiformis]|uniref:Uncharacterized protein n=1 Tax=Cymbomonas tetramitiformis TaxID=36881 RepID=A0AAE0EN57_9CHLO|nr:hypothetical protein CYMTET_55874 [Cymbomonas tetramitiformis]
MMSAFNLNAFPLDSAVWEEEYLEQLSYAFTYSADIIAVLRPGGYNPKHGYTLDTETADTDFNALIAAFRHVLYPVSFPEFSKLLDLEHDYDYYHMVLNEIIFTVLPIVLRGREEEYLEQLSYAFTYSADIIAVLRPGGYNPKHGYTLDTETADTDFNALIAAFRHVLYPVSFPEFSKLLDLEHDYDYYHMVLNEIIFTVLPIVLRGREEEYLEQLSYAFTYSADIIAVLRPGGYNPKHGYTLDTETADTDFNALIAAFRHVLYPVSFPEFSKLLDLEHDYDYYHMVLNEIIFTVLPIVLRGREEEYLEQLSYAFTYSADIIAVLRPGGYNPKHGYTLDTETADTDFNALIAAFRHVLYPVSFPEFSKLLDLEHDYDYYHMVLNEIIFTVLPIVLRGTALALYTEAAYRYQKLDPMGSLDVMNWHWPGFFKI